MKTYEIKPANANDKPLKKYAFTSAERVTLADKIRSLQDRMDDIGIEYFSTYDLDTVPMLKSFTHWYVFTESRMFDISPKQIFKVTQLIQNVYGDKQNFWTWTGFKSTGTMSYFDFEAHELERKQIKIDLKWEEAEKIAPGCRTSNRSYLMKH